ncbi:MAG: ABC transporter ATP-binding protein [Syntrophales bacterium]|nr:ABC transporter ATP-binding protein [Syntrophales bacterium]
MILHSNKIKNFEKTNGDTFIEVVDLSIQYGGVWAAKDICLRIHKGEIFGIVGSDGAGKSTLLRAMATLIPPTTGHITIEKFDTSADRKFVKSILGYMPQRFALYPDLTVLENMEFFMDVFHMEKQKRGIMRNKFLAFTKLEPFSDRRAGDLSGGMKQKLGLACVLLHEPKVLILDEPTNGVDPLSRMEFWQMLTRMRNEDCMTIVVATSYLDEGEKCDRLALMHNSELIEVAAPVILRKGFADLEEAIIDRLTKTDRELAYDTFRR